MLKINSSATSASIKTINSFLDPHGNGEEDILPVTNVPSGQARARHANTLNEYFSALEINSRADKIRLSGIICTIGPVSKRPDFLLKMIEAGMNVARMNFSHGSHEYHAETIMNCRQASKMYLEATGFNPNLAIALDTKGPEIRTGMLEGDDGRKEVMLETGSLVRLTTDDAFRDKCTEHLIWLDYKNITKVLSVGKRIFIDDGLISIKATEIGQDFVQGEVENGGFLGSRKGCNLPGTNTDLPAVSEKDIQDINFGIEQGVDMIFASFIRDADGVKRIREILGEAGKKILIIPKIENQQGMNNIDEIIAASDGIMVARGDMGIEIPPEKVFIAQKQIIAKCNKAGKPVICATQMLESMVKKPRPTRAEGSDVANAILDGSDCVMLSGETAKGDFPLQCIRTMASLSREAEACIWNQRLFEDLLRSEHGDKKCNTTAVAISSVQAAYSTKASAIIGLTTSGLTAHMASKYRPQCPFMAITRDAQVARQLQLYRGVVPIHYDKPRDSEWAKDIDNRIQYCIDFGTLNGFIKSGDPVICITGWRKGAGSSNTIRIMQVE